MARVIHVNKFSLHAAYGNRIMRAYLGASRGTERKPNPFTGFDPDDNAYFDVFTDDDVKRPLHVVNIALNLVHGRNLAWQERKAASLPPVRSTAAVTTSATVRPGNTAATGECRSVPR